MSACACVAVSVRPLCERFCAMTVALQILSIPCVRARDACCCFFTLLLQPDTPDATHTLPGTVAVGEHRTKAVKNLNQKLMQTHVCRQHLLYSGKQWLPEWVGRFWDARVLQQYSGEHRL